AVPFQDAISASKDKVPPCGPYQWPTATQSTPWAHDTSSTSLPTPLGGSGTGSNFQRWPFHCSTSGSLKLPSLCSPTARHRSGAPHETCSSTFPPVPGLGGTRVSVHCSPSHVSARGSATPHRRQPKVTPTPTQFVVDVHETS